MVAGYTVYQFDRNYAWAHCTTTAVGVQDNFAIGCRPHDRYHDRLATAVTTTRSKPVAGPGVQQRLLGTVYRKDIGADQVTSAGKLLYLFDPKPNMFTGASFMETALPLPPWHGVWWLVSRKGRTSGHRPSRCWA